MYLPLTLLRGNEKPVGAKPPTFSLEYKLIEVQKLEHTGFALLCQAQAYPVPIIRANWCQSACFPRRSANFFKSRCEPVGAKAPTFSSDSKGSIFVRTVGSSFALLCQAQAFPVPIISVGQSFALLCQAQAFPVPIIR
ncbi:unnamed protein product [Ceratitis capitata]|uniref:(Mediterranean fruit fly) hypothetical protein n=1 Tax=Ceratitis capitata TaxID=7213 RepID=A0A811VD09_CERCA|nr:unnamed protein product [Ceratitis capitata]